MGELRYGAQNEDQPQVMAVELASLTTEDGGSGSGDAVHQAIRARAICTCRSNRRRWSFGSSRFHCHIAPNWSEFAKQNGLDPFLVAALIRQESEFNPKAVSQRECSRFDADSSGDGP